MSTDTKDLAAACARLLGEHNGGEPVVLGLGKLSSWTDFFVIATATSSTHLRGLYRHLEEHFAQTGQRPTRKPTIGDEEEWVLVDMGDYVVHLMSARAREFYELEKLWFEAERLEI